MGDHGFDRLEHDTDGRYVIVCECGWQSDAESTAGAVGVEWDAHRELAGVTNGS